jgi:gamma-glutamyltranspeptidase/glutathione hydrolase
MNRISCIVALIATSITYAPVNAFQSNQVLTGQSAENMVASVHPLATEAGLGAFEKDGNAIDAAVSTALMLGVVDGFNSGIGGGCFILIRTADGQLIAIDGREMAPAAAQRDMYLREQKVDTRLSQTGPLAIGIPGALAAYHQAVTEFGKLPFNELVTPAADVAEQGFPVTEAYQKKIESASKDLARFPGSAAVLLKGDGSIYEAGEILIQADLANTYRQIAKNGPSWFYNGPFAKQLESWMQQNGGIVTARDMANYQTVRRQPVRTRYREYEIVGFPPPSSGGVHVAQILNILESFDL